MLFWSIFGEVVYAVRAVLPFLACVLDQLLYPLQMPATATRITCRRCGVMEGA